MMFWFLVLYSCFLWGLLWSAMDLAWWQVLIAVWAFTWLLHIAKERWIREGERKVRRSRGKESGGPD